MCAPSFPLQSEELPVISISIDRAELQVKASHAVEPFLIYLGTVLPCLEGRGMEMRLGMQQDSEGGLRA